MKTIGITQIDPLFTLSDNTLKSDLIYFDEVMYTFSDGLDKLCSSVPEWSEAYRLKLKELEKLEKVGLAKSYKEVDLKSSSNIKSLEEVLSYKQQARQVFKGYTTKKKKIKDVLEEFFQRSRDLAHIESKADSVILNRQSEDHFIPIIRNNYYNFSPGDANQLHTVASVILKKFPKISGNVSLEKLVEFKKDPDTIIKLARLRNWSIELSKRNFNEKEIEQNMDYLLNEYIEQMRIHKIKYKFGQIETLTILAFEVLEHILKLNWGKAAKAMFDIGKQKVHLLEAEQNFKGRELALIYKLNETDL